MDRGYKNIATNATVSVALGEFLNRQEKKSRLQKLTKFCHLQEQKLVSFDMPLINFGLLDHVNLVKQFDDQETVDLYNEFTTFALN